MEIIISEQELYNALRSSLEYNFRVDKRLAEALSTKANSIINKALDQIDLETPINKALDEYVKSEGFKEKLLKEIQFSVNREFTCAFEGRFTKIAISAATALANSDEVKRALIETAKQALVSK